MSKRRRNGTPLTRPVYPVPESAQGPLRQYRDALAQIQQQFRQARSEMYAMVGGIARTLGVPEDYDLDIETMKFRPKPPAEPKEPAKAPAFPERLS